MTTKLDQQQITQLSFDESSSALKVLPVAGSIVPAVYDYMSLSYTGNNITTIVYKTGGSGGTVTATLTIAYDINNNITSITRS